jgi:hypothetical protein
MSSHFFGRISHQLEIEHVIEYFGDVGFLMVSVLMLLLPLFNLATIHLYLNFKFVFK